MIQAKQEWNEAAWCDIERWKGDLADMIANGHGTSTVADTVRGWISETLKLIAG